MPVHRLNESALGLLERPVLAWMASRLSPRITPDCLTLIGIAGAVTAAAGYLASRWSLQWLWLASAGLLINWFGDSLDGTIARRRGIQREQYGFFVDHTSDLFTQSLVFLALGISPCAQLRIACLGLIAFLMAFVYSLICVKVRGTMRVTYFGFGPTEMRALLIAGNLLTIGNGVVDVGRWFAPARLGPLTVYDFVIVILFTLAVAALLVLALRERRALALDDPARVPAHAVTVASAPVTAAASPSLGADIGWR